MLCVDSFSQSKLINAAKTIKVTETTKEKEAKEGKKAEEKKTPPPTKKTVEKKTTVKSSSIMEITGITFANCDKLGNIFDDYGADLYANEIKYLHPRIFYKGLVNATKDVTLFIKIIKEDGTLCSGTSSPNGYTYQVDEKIEPGDGKMLNLSGWGNNEKTYNAGQYKFEICYNGNIIFQKGFRILPGKRPLTRSKLIKINDIKFGIADNNGNFTKKPGETLFENEIEYLQPEISYEGDVVNEQNATLMIRIVLSDGNMSKGNSSPLCFTTKNNITIKPGKNTIVISGWGNNAKNLYKYGKHLYEIWLDGDKIYETPFYVEKKKEEDNSKEIYAANGQKIENTKIVDLGLSSGTKWAGWNIGALKPSDKGGYYAWGEVETKSEYTWNTYFDVDDVTDSENVTFKKYSNKTKTSIVDTNDDVARKKWGNNWRMPTKKQIDELLRDCEWTWTKLDGVNGFAVKGPNGKAIFMPAAGCYFDSSVIKQDGKTCFYWCGELENSSIFTTRASCLIMADNYGKYYDRNGERCDGKSVRAVYVEDAPRFGLG